MAIRGITSFVSYQARGAPGAQIQQFGPHSGYVELDGLLRFVTGMHEWPGEIRLTHGEAQAKAQPRQLLARVYERNGLDVLVQIPDLIGLDAKR